jgi:hypothetical protein
VKSTRCAHPLHAERDSANVSAAMKPSRLLLPLLLALSLLSAQGAGAAHTIRHALQNASQQDKHTTHDGACEKCENYFQLGSALNVGTYTPPLLDAPAEMAAAFVEHSTTLALPSATARGPPARLS